MFYFRILAASLLMFTAACGETTPAAAGDNEASEWWEEDGSNTDTTATTDTPADTGDKPDDGVKPEDDGDKPDEESGEVDNWAATIDTELGTGTFTYTKTTVSGEDCQLSYPVLEANPLDTCADCTFAWDLLLGEVDITLDAGGCGDYAIISNHSLNYGQGSAVFAEYGGITYYDLYYSEDGETWTSNDGYSSVDGTTWTFGAK